MQKKRKEKKERDQTFLYFNFEMKANIKLSII
jgi:hypothetical protein